MRRATLMAMEALKAQVRNGRLVMDEATELPEGTEVRLVLADDELDDEERAELETALREGIAEMRAGQTLDGPEAIARLRARL